MFKKIGVALGAVSGILLPVIASAQVTYESQVSTTTEFIGLMTADILTTVLYAVGSVLGIAVLLVGVGYAWRKLKSKAVGKAF